MDAETTEKIKHMMHDAELIQHGLADAIRAASKKYDEIQDVVDTLEHLINFDVVMHAPSTPEEETIGWDKGVESKLKELSAENPAYRDLMWLQEAGVKQ